MNKYAIVNASTLVSDSDVQTMWRAVKDQIFYQVAPAWGRDFMDSTFVAKGGTVPAGAYPIYVLDNPDVADALGYHTEDPQGNVYGRVFAQPVLDNHGTALSGELSVSSVLSHEVIEFFIDIHCNEWADRGDGTMVAYEACDPVENDSYLVHPVIGSKVVPVSVSNFVLDKWFDCQSPTTGIQFDWLKKLSAPLTMTAGGYQVVLDTTTGKTTQVFASRIAETLHNAIKPMHVSARSSRRLGV
jgi:hypothetical protein